MKLTAAQKKVIVLLQRGEGIAAGGNHFYVSDGFNQHKIQNRVWGILTNKLGLIIQEFQYPFDYVLTEKGKIYENRKL